MIVKLTPLLRKLYKEAMKEEAFLADLTERAPIEDIFSTDDLSKLIIANIFKGWKLALGIYFEHDYL